MDKLEKRKINNLEILEEISHPYTGSSPYRKTVLKLKCKCICGSIFTPYKSNVMRGKTKQCSRCSQTHKMLNKKFGSLLVLERDFSKSNTCFFCRCDCGETSSIEDRYLKRGKDKRCKGCRNRDRRLKKLRKSQEKSEALNKRNELRMNQLLKKIGQTSGRLTIIQFHGFSKRKNGTYPNFICICECGNQYIIRNDHIGKVVSCGCLQKESIKHGEQNKRAKLKNIQAQEIRNLYSSNLYTASEIANIYNVSPAVINNIIKNKTYKI